MRRKKQKAPSVHREGRRGGEETGNLRARSFGQRFLPGYLAALRLLTAEFMHCSPVSAGFHLEQRFPLTWNRTKADVLEYIQSRKFREGGAMLVPGAGCVPGVARIGREHSSAGRRAQGRHLLVH